MFDLNQIKAIPIANVSKDFGFVLSKGGTGRCRLPGHNDRQPSFSIRSCTNRFTCFACDNRGSVIDLVKLMLGVDFVAACHWLDKNYLNGGAGSPSVNNNLNRLSPILRRQAAVNAPATKQSDTEVFKWLLDHSPLRPSGAEYLAMRGFSKATTAHFRIGQMQDRREILKAARAKFGNDRLLNCGLVKQFASGEGIVFPENYLLFPFLVGDRVEYVQARRADSQLKWRWLCLADLPPPLFNKNVLSQAANTITLCEGITDVLSAHELGMHAVGVLGASARLDIETAALFRCRNLAVVGDGDAAGVKFSLRISTLFATLGFTVIRKRLPSDCNDLNDFLLATRNKTIELA